MLNDQKNTFKKKHFFFFFISIFNLARKLTLRAYKKLPISRYSTTMKLLTFFAIDLVFITFSLTYLLWERKSTYYVYITVVIGIGSAVLLFKYLGELLLYLEKRKPITKESHSNEQTVEEDKQIVEIELERGFQNDNNF